MLNPLQRFFVNQAAKALIKEDRQAKRLQSATSVNMPFLNTGPGRSIIWQAQEVQSYINDGYAGNDIVYSIVRLIIEKAKIAPWSEYKVKDAGAYQKFNAFTKNPHSSKNIMAEYLDLRHKALEPVDGYSKIKELLQYPNAQDTWSDLVEKWGGWKLTTGNTFIYGPLISGGTNKGLPNRLFDLSPAYMQIFSNPDAFPVEPVGYQFFLSNIQKFTLEEIMHDKYWNPIWDSAGRQLFGLSPLYAASKILTRDNEGKTASVAEMENQGLEGIISMKPIPGIQPHLMGNEAAAIKKVIIANSGAKNAGSIAATGYDVNFVKTRSPMTESVLKAEIYNQRGLANVYGGIPTSLLNDPEAGTYNSRKEAEKALTTRGALPLLCSIRDNMNRKKNGDWKQTGKTVIDFDLCVYQELEENRAEQVDWLAKAEWLPLKMKYDLMGLEVPPYIDQKYIEEIYLSSGKQSLEDLNIGEDLPIDMNDYNKIKP